MTATKPTAQTQTTRTIAGHTMTLTSGRRYLASRDFVTRGRSEYDVSITDITDGVSFSKVPTREVTGLSYGAANALLEAFNDGESSFEGRVWA